MECAWNSAPGAYPGGDFPSSNAIILGACRSGFYYDPYHDFVACEQHYRKAVVVEADPRYALAYFNLAMSLMKPAELMRP